jgi:hypothetical protein
MRHSSALTAIAAAAAALLAAAGAAHAAAAPLPALSAAQIVERNVAARGGLEAWRAVQTIQWKGRMGAGATTYPVVLPGGTLRQRQREEPQLPYTLEFKRPAKLRLELEFGGQAAVQVFDGVRGWKYRPFLGRNEWESYTPEEVQLAADEPGVDGYLIDYAAKGARVESAGADKVDGHDAYKLKVTLKSGQTRHIWIDAQSFLDVQVEGEPRKLDGRMHAVLIHLRDFRPEQGLMFPHTQETVVQGVARTEKILIEKVAVNPSLVDARFTRS